MGKIRRIFVCFFTKRLLCKRGACIIKKYKACPGGDEPRWLTREQKENRYDEKEDRRVGADRLHGIDPAAPARRGRPHQRPIRHGDRSADAGDGGSGGEHRPCVTGGGTPGLHPAKNGERPGKSGAAAVGRRLHARSAAAISSGGAGTAWPPDGAGAVQPPCPPDQCVRRARRVQ